MLIVLTRIIDRFFVVLRDIVMMVIGAAILGGFYVLCVTAPGAAGVLAIIVVGVMMWTSDPRNFDR